MATHSSILAWRIPWTEEPGGLQVHRVAQSWTQLKRLSTHPFCCYPFRFHFLFDVEFFCMYSEVKSIYIVLLFLILFLGFWYYGYIRFTKCSWDIFVFLCGLHSLNSIGMICSLKSLWNPVLKPSFLKKFIHLKSAFQSGLKLSVSEGFVASSWVKLGSIFTADRFSTVSCRLHIIFPCNYFYVHLVVCWSWLASCVHFWV